MLTVTSTVIKLWETESNFNFPQAVLQLQITNKNFNTHGFKKMASVLSS